MYEPMSLKCSGRLERDSSLQLTIHLPASKKKAVSEENLSLQGGEKGSNFLCRFASELEVS